MEAINRQFKYLDNSWWVEWLRSIFPEHYGCPDPSWNNPLFEALFNDLFKDDMRTASADLWYKSGEFIFSYHHIPNHRPHIQAGVLGTKINISKFFKLEHAEKEIQIIEALADPNLLPLCLNTWAEPFIAHYFAKIA